jgi:hypothetical protein
MTYNPKKRLAIEIEANDNSACNGYTIWRTISGIRKHAMSRKADGKDFDWMTSKEFEKFSCGRQWAFSISAKDASEYFDYVY